MKTGRSQPKRRRPGGCLRVFLFTLLGIFLAAAAALYVLLGTSPVPQETPVKIDLERLRAAAGEQSKLPVRLNTLIVADGAYPSAMVVAGSGLGTMRMAFPTFQIVYEDGTVVVDAPHSQAAHASTFPGMPYTPEAYDQMQEAMRNSRLVLATHEHFDHLGGLASSPYWDEIRPKLRLTRAQLEHIGPEVGFPAGALEGLTLLPDFSNVYAAAPGVVLVPAAGHTPGSQMIYVRLQNGAEYLLVGDVVWNSLSLERQSGRSLLASLALREDRSIHGQQVRALINLAGDGSINMVISHDGEQIEEYIDQGLIGYGFE